MQGMFSSEAAPPRPKAKGKSAQSKTSSSKASTSKPKSSTSKRSKQRKSIRPKNLERIEIRRIIDGDTVDLDDGRRLRFIGINTPEREQPFYEEATALNRRLTEGKDVYLELDQEHEDHYGRLLGYVWAGDVMVNLALVVNGYANVLFVPPNDRYEEPFRKAEADAKKAGRGIWAASDAPLKIITIKANARGNDNENPNDEWIEIENQGRKAVQMRGFTLKDSGNHFYEFGDFEVKAGQRFVIRSGAGRDTKRELFWGLVDDSVWTNSGDAAFLRDRDGNLVDSYQY